MAIKQIEVTKPKTKEELQKINEEKVKTEAIARLFAKKRAISNSKGSKR